jgi:hypothetical protein
MMLAIEDAVKICEKKSYLLDLAYYDSALGVIIDCIKPSKSKSDLHISNSVLQHHISMLKILQYIFKYNLKPVRPLRLFDPNVRFCGSLLTSVSPVASSPDSLGKIEQERDIFIEKLLEADPCLVRDDIINAISW